MRVIEIEKIQLNRSQVMEDPVLTTWTSTNMKGIIVCLVIKRTIVCTNIKSNSYVQTLHKCMSFMITNE